MTRIAAPFQAPVPPALAPGAAASAVLADLPPALRDLAQGTFLNGIVLDRNGNSGLTMLLTSSGVIGLKTTMPLPTGSTVTLQVQSAGAQLQAIVLSVTPQQSGGDAPVPTPALPSASAAPPAPAIIPAAIDGPAGAPSTITATVIGPASTSPPAPPAPAMSPPIPSNAAGVPPDPLVAGPKTAPGPVPASNAPVIAATSVDLETPAQPAPVPTPIAHQQTSAYQKQMASTPLPASGRTPSAPPAPAVAPAASLPPATSTAAAPVMPTPTGAAAPAMPPAPLPSGAQIQVRLLAIETSGQMPPMPRSGATALPLPPVPASEMAQTSPPASRAPITTPATPPAASVDAIVTARTPAGQTILDTAVGRLLLTLPKTLAAAPLGVRLLLELLPVEKPAIPVPVATPSGPPALAREWPALREALNVLQDTPDPDARAALDRALPKPGPHLAQQILNFIETAAQGGTKAWLGDAAARTLERMPGGLVGRLDHDLKDMLAAPRGADANWHLTIVPFLDGRDLRQIRFFERRRKDDGAKRRREDPARFVIECDHSELGPMQIDGLMHERRLDMVLRSHDPLPAEMERDILVLFDQTCAGLGVHGQLAFHAVPGFPVNPIDEFGDVAVEVSV